MLNDGEERLTKRGVKVVDFGIAGICRGNDKEETNAGTLRYMPPEIHSGENILANAALDIWAIGVMLYYMVYGFYPFDGATRKEIAKNIKEQEVDFPPPTEKDPLFVTEEFKDIMRGMLAKK